MAPVTQTTSIEIEAAPDLVWEVLTSFDDYPSWNRYASAAIGELRNGAKVRITVPDGRGGTRDVDNVITMIVPRRRLCWRSLGWYRVLVSGVRCRDIEELADGRTRFTETETTTGPLAGFIHRSMGEQLLDGLRVECESLKHECETRASAP